MNFIAEINVMPLKELLDPQGKAVAGSMKNLNLNEIADIRIGKHITMKLAADTREAAETKVKTACDKLLANPIMEYYEFDLQEA